MQEQVRAAAETIRELRAENARLKQQVDELSQRPDVGEDDVFIHLDGERAELRDRIQQFIDAIDDHLERSPDSGIEPDWPETPPEAPHLAEETNLSEEKDAAGETDGDKESHQPDDLTGPPPEETVDASATGGGNTDSSAIDASAPPPSAPPPNAETPDAETPNAQTAEEDMAREGEPVLQDGLPDDGEFEVEVADAASEDRTDESPCCPEDDPYEPRTLSPGLQPRRSARRRR